jgi:heme/copper-type cytochrome/quinol oxidase subunit 2
MERLKMVDVIMLAIPVVLVLLLLLGTWQAWKRHQEQKSGHAVKDERTELATGKAARITVLATGYFLLALLWYVFVAENFGWGLPGIETAWALIISVLFNALLYAGLSWYFSR